VVGGFYSKVDREYHQRLPTPGYDVFVDARFAARCVADDPATPTFDESSRCKVPATLTPFTAVDVANGFPADSPYNADLPYDIKQGALFGEASYDFGQFKITGGGRYYNFKEKRDFISGGLFSNGDTFIGDKTKSSGFSPRVIATWEPSRNLSVNLQAAKGFRLGGVNDPLNLPLCDNGVPNGPDAATFGGFPTYDDETLWNYEAGVKYQKGWMTLNAAAFYTDISDLQVTADAGSCSSRVVFNAPKAHTQGVELEFSMKPSEGFDFSIAGSLIQAEFDKDLRTSGGDIIAGIREGNRLPTVPKFQVAATATYGERFRDTGDWYVTASAQHIGSRYTQPADQEGPALTTFEHGFDFNGMDPTDVTRLDLKLPSYELINLSAGLDFDSGLGVSIYLNNLLDADPKLSFDRERGGRARLGFNVGQPRTIGMTVRQKFGN
jgi:iron complex outermembrane receptor protein